MNTVDDNDRNNLVYAEYVLGVLDADARAAVAREVASSDEAATAVAIWQRHLGPLSEEIADLAPPEYLWSRIKHALGFDAQGHAEAPSAPLSLWENLRLWHWIGIGASVIATACMVIIMRPLTPASHEVAGTPVAGTTVMVSTIKQTNGVAGWTATMDIERKQIVVVPATPADFDADRSTELWLIPAGQKPISVGVFAPAATTTLTLSPALLAQLGPTTVLAVTLEPLGGSPSGAPTGPVIATGDISGAPAGKPIAVQLSNVDPPRA